MSIPLSAGTYAQDDTIVSFDNAIHANDRTASTIDFEPDYNKGVANPEPENSRRKPGQLKMLDDLFGPFKIGPYTITRRGLDALGATIDGQPLTGHNTQFRTPSRSFLNTLQLSYHEIEKRMKVSTFGDDYLLPSLLYEMACLRPPTAPPVIREETRVKVEEGSYSQKMSRLLNSAQNLDLRLAYSKNKSSPSWIIIKNHSTIGASVGIQAFGIFMGIRGIYDAVKKNDKDEIIFNSIGIGTEVGSIITDIAVTKAGQRMIEAGSGALKDFAKTRAGIRLGRSGGLIGGALTLPFDIYSAVREFNAASNKTGKEAMDHYVSAGLNVASAAMTVILGAAALAGFSFAGPVGLAAGALMAIGSQIYGAVRMVDEIDDYIELTVEERWRTGWFSFVPLMDIDQNIKNRYELAKAKIETAKRLQTTARKLLDETQKDTIEAVVHGRYEDRLKKRRERVKHWWGVETMPIVYVPEVVGLDDTIDARDGVTAETPGAVLGTPGEDKGILWLIGDGKDTVTGVEKKPNAFYYAEGIKDLTGGDKDDKFVAQNAQDVVRLNIGSTEFSRLKGGAGSDTLILDGKQTYHGDGSGFDIDLAAGTLQIYTPNPDPAVEDGERYSFKALLESIENVQTLSDGKSIVTGTRESNVITSRGADKINAGDGNDTIYLLKNDADAFGEAGTDFYHVALAEGSVLITEDGADESYISLGWRMDQIVKWEVRLNRLNITVNYDFHYGRESTISIDDVYNISGNHLVLNNNKLTIITRDGYYLKPDLPEKIENHGHKVFGISAEIIKVGRPERTTIVYEPVCHVPSLQNTNYYVQRFSQHTQFITGSHPDAYYGTRIFLDYDSTEMTSAHAAFSTTPSIKMNPAADKDKINVSCDFLFFFDKKLVQIVGVGQYTETTLEAALKNAAAKRSTHGYMLVFRDGKAHTLILEEAYAKPPAHYKPNVNGNTLTSHNFRLPIRMKDNAVFELPETQALKLDHLSYCTELLPISAQTAIDNIEGGGATYLIHLRENRVLRISTPGGLATASAQLNHSSTWYLDATKLVEFNIALEDSKLYIGTTTLHLPQYGAEDLIDEIYVIAPKGVVHTVDLSFDRIYINSLDARYFEPPIDANADLPEEFTAIAQSTLDVRHIAMSDGSRGRLKYSMPDRKWILDSDKAREITYSQLEVFGRCKDQLPDVFKLALPDN
ncbi:calcium-binding protein [Pseudomonas sp. FP2196]|uniref:calcium-binding protein n=1 Tax=Pseudomonas sp. FP2196 TaxID=2954086 RepID=UPI0027341628|nr:calcium-binding protein [Pseudomonas sp. FP2196]WLH37379.1 calcium-binding protein [Pseudomonas sp. FP2196]